MSFTAQFQIQKAIATKLTGDVTLMGLVTTVGSNMPTTATMPYVVIGDVTATPWPTFGHRNRDTTVTLHVWSASPSDGEADAILARIDELLDSQTLTLLDGWSCVRCVNENVNAVRTPGDSDVGDRHIIARYRIQAIK